MNNRRKKAFALFVIYSLIIFKLNSRRNMKVNYNEEYDKCGDSYFACLDDKNIFIVDDRDSFFLDDNIYVIDSRYDDDPNMIVYNSYKIKSIEEIKELLKILKEYERQYPSKLSTNTCAKVIDVCNKLFSIFIPFFIKFNDFIIKRLSKIYFSTLPSAYC